MIRRSGARTIPDVLRLAPGVEVKRKLASIWEVTIRGFNGTNADKLLVQIDGRTVYSPLFGGVYWDVQDLVLEDVERIEVVRGPGATIWGANAVNGVINIITKGSNETQGGYFEGGGGTEERGFTTARYGGKLGDNATYRLYGKWFDRDGGSEQYGRLPDDWRQARTGFRIDWTPQPSDAFTLQGDYYDGYDGLEGNMRSPSPPFEYHYTEDQHVSGGNILGRWTHVLDKESDWSVQWYYDRAERHNTLLPLVLDTDIIDLDFQHRFPLADRHSLIWGLGYRNSSDYTRAIPLCLEFDPAKRADDVFSCFVQDQMTLREDLLYFTLGSKFEFNDYTGFEMQPTARLLWTPDKKHCIWGAVSRAVQTPTRLTSNGALTYGPDFPGYLPPGMPLFSVYHGMPTVESAELIAYEVGMRAQPVKRFYWDFTAFYNDYQKLLGVVPGTPYLGFTSTGYLAAFFPGYAISNVPGETYGFELAAGLDVTERWKLRGAYSFLRVFEHEPPNTFAYLGEDAPRNMYYLWLSGDLGRHWSLDVIGRYFDEENIRYFVGDVRLAWQPRPNIEWSVVGRNLLAGIHNETTGHSDLFGIESTQVEPEVYGAVTYRF
jgi:iron complex outermembrane receptor protein